nr:MAG TPA: hypothetical protein [Caudoviricetes sp.]
MLKMLMVVYSRSDNLYLNLIQTSRLRVSNR